MSLAIVLSTYLSVQLLVICGYVGLLLCSYFLRLVRMQVSARSELSLHYIILICIAISMLIQPLLPKPHFLEPAAKIWSAQSAQIFSRDKSEASKGGYISLSQLQGVGASASHMENLILFMIAGGFIGGISIWLRDFLRLRRIQRSSFIVRKIGRVRIFLNDHIVIPFSYWYPGQANVVIPSSMLLRVPDFRLAVLHELQHHRNRDTRFIYLMAVLRWTCIFNPCAFLWSRWISEIQEFACDETLVDQQKVDSQAYARCLVEVAQTVVLRRHASVSATGIMFLTEHNILKRRIEKMFIAKKKIGRSAMMATAIALVGMMTATAFAAKSLIQDRRVTMAQAQEMLQAVGKAKPFPITINEQVLVQLNRYVGTPEGRDFMRMSLRRAESYRTMLAQKLEQYSMPSELLAIPIVESGYQNLIQGKNQKWGAGLWMFIQQTARNYGLKVDAKQDERMSEVLETDAAMRYLNANYMRFKDWPLAILAYNIGENTVQKGIVQTGSRDAWTVLRGGFENDNDYLAKVFAAVLVMKNPQVLE